MQRWEKFFESFFGKGQNLRLPSELKEKTITQLIEDWIERQREPLIPSVPSGSRGVLGD
jgi:hypothetical protein